MTSTVEPQRENENERLSPNRALIVHDSLAFLVLAAITIVLYGVTLFLFRTFEEHRAELNKRWSDRGRVQLRQHQAQAAVASLRAALAYAPDDYSSQLLLAEALAAAGETDQATSYFLNMMSAKPGDGFLNLQMARLTRRAGNTPRAIEYYRKAIFGDWQGEAIQRRRETRLELIDYLIDLKQLAAARAEILIAASNNPESEDFDLLFADRLKAANDPGDAMSFYRKAIEAEPRNQTALEAAGRLAYATGNYAEARGLLVQAIEAEPKKASESLRTTAHDAERLVELSLSRELPAQERERHILTDAKIAENRLAACAVAPATAPAGAAAAGASVSSSASTPVDAGIAYPVPQLQARWKLVGAGSKRDTLVQNAAGQDALAELILDTERATAGLATCGAPSGDDALLLKLATATSQPASFMSGGAQ